MLKEDVKVGIGILIFMMLTIILLGTSIIGGGFLLSHFSPINLMIGCVIFIIAFFGMAIIGTLLMMSDAADDPEWSKEEWKAN